MFKESERLRSYERRQKKKDSEFIIADQEANEIALMNASSYKTEKEEERESELLTEVYKIIENELSEDEQRIIYCAFFGKKTQKEYAKMLGISEAVFSSKKKAALSKIRSIINKK